MKLTTRQNQIYEAIVSMFLSDQLMPSVNDLSIKFNCQRNNIHGHLQAIEKKGFITRVHGQSRGIILNKFKVQLVEAKEV